MTGLYLSRLTLRPDPSVAALAQALMPIDDTRLNTDHRAVWSLFAAFSAPAGMPRRRELRHALLDRVPHTREDDRSSALPSESVSSSPHRGPEPIVLEIWAVHVVQQS